MNCYIHSGPVLSRTLSLVSTARCQSEYIQILQSKFYYRINKCVGFFLLYMTMQYYYELDLMIGDVGGSRWS